jgi:hypothetical protein
VIKVIQRDKKIVKEIQGIDNKRLRNAVFVRYYKKLEKL